jgi:hypothetical protein
MLRSFQEKVDKTPLRHVKHYWLTIAFLLGFLVDNITLNRVDQIFDNAILLTQVVLAMSSILLLYAAIAEKLPTRWCRPVQVYAPLVTQYAFGGLLSGMLIFYGRSGAWAESWPFLAVILAVIYGNETIRDRAGRLVFNLSVLFIGLFSYVVLIVPVVTGVMGAWVFVGSSLLALGIMRLYVKLLKRIIPNFLELQMRTVVFAIGSIFVGFQTLYFTNIIPPIPLSLKDVGIYHSVVRFENGDYQLTYEPGRWWQPFKDSDRVFHPTPGSNVFCFAQVFAPTRLSTDIYHRWEYYNEETGEWQTHARLSYPISGGRSQGYRGYTLIRNYQPGSWRCTVETGRGQVLGRERFQVDASEPPGELVTRIE